MRTLSGDTDTQETSVIHTEMRTITYESLQVCVTHTLKNHISLRLNKDVSPEFKSSVINMTLPE